MKVYRSRIGWEIWIPAFFIVWSTAFPIFQDTPKYGIMVPSVISVILGLVILSTRYAISGTTLRIKSAFLIDVKLDVRNIYQIRKTLNPISSPAAALIGRIKIYCKDGSSVIISPVNKKQFLADLLKINGSINTKDAI